MRDLSDLSEPSRRIGSVANKYGVVYTIVFGSVTERRCVEGESAVDLTMKLKRIEETYSFLKSFASEQHRRAITGFALSTPSRCPH